MEAILSAYFIQTVNGYEEGEGKGAGAIFVSVGRPTQALISNCRASESESAHQPPDTA